MARRRQLLAASASLIAGGIAGCTSSSQNTGSNGSSSNETAAGNNSQSGGTTGNTSQTEGTTNGSGSYTVTVKPFGSHTFQKVPQTFLTHNWIDIGMAFGKMPKAAGSLSRHPEKFYKLLPNVNYNENEITELEGREGYDKEIFYQVNPDVILMDPRYLKHYANWDDADIQEIAQNVAPFLGSQIHQPIMGTKPYYDLYGAFEKAGKIFQRQDQFQAWKEFHTPYLSDIQSRLPPKEKRPTATLLINGVSPDSGEFYPVSLQNQRKDTRTLRQLGLKDAFAGQSIDGAVGYEALLQADPDVIASPSLGNSYKEFMNGTVKPFENNPKGSQLTAVQNGNIVRVSGHYMGPIIDLFSLEAGAKQVFPDEFGEWPGPIADFSNDEQLFDRQRVSDLINGNV
jgi:iron complex transport system substrate-binding protein